MALYVNTNLFAGVDGIAWQAEHRMHHAFTLSDRDPQIPMHKGALMPICATDEAPLADFLARHPLGGTMLRWQEVFFVPFLTVMGKHYLAFLTYRRISRPKVEPVANDHQQLRKLLLLGHYLLLAAAVWLFVWKSKSARHHTRSQGLQNVAFWLLGCSCGAGLIEPMFLFNHVHTGRSTHRHASDRVAQMCHTINYQMRLPWWLPLDELLMPVAYHIEHHIAPKVPDENLPRITADIQRVAAQFGLPFRTQRIETLAWDYTRQLARVPRDRWGGAGAVVPIVLPILLATLCWLSLTSPRLASRARVVNDSDGVMTQKELEPLLDT